MGSKLRDVINEQPLTNNIGNIYYLPLVGVEVEVLTALELFRLDLAVKLSKLSNLSKQKFFQVLGKSFWQLLSMVKHWQRQGQLGQLEE